MSLKLELLRKIQNKDAKCSILALFETMFCKLELLRNLFERTGLKLFTLTICETMFWTLELLRKGWCFRCLNCFENFESKEAKICILNRSKEYGRRLLGELVNVGICSSLK